MTPRIWPVQVALASLSLLVAGCGGGGPDATAAPAPPVGKPLLPDLVAAPPKEIHLQLEKGRVVLRFSSILMNVGPGDFILRATRQAEGLGWHVVQDIPYSRSGAKPTVVAAKVVWGGDGHDHWHIRRVAKTWLVPLDKGGKPVSGASRIYDAKIGFCFYDDDRLLESGPDEAVYVREGCGKRNDNAIAMGLSHGWIDDYSYVLRGQAIDITDVANGRYRLFDVVDERGWFLETTRANDVSWADIALSTKDNGERAVLVADTAPTTRPTS